MEKSYIEIMIQSLEKKREILNRLVELNNEQKLLLQDPNLDVDDFDRNMEQKGTLIEEIGLLDDGFEKLFQRIKEELTAHKEAHADEIHRMQELIRELSALSMSIQAQEARNKVLVEEKFQTVRRQVKSVRNSQRVVKQYYDGMKKMQAHVPQYLDDKK